VAFDPQETCSRESMVAWTTLCNLHVPEKRRVKLEDVTDVLSERGRLKPFPPRHVRHFAESYLLDFVGQNLSSGLIGRSHPVGDKFLQQRNLGPAVPGAFPVAHDAEVDGGINDVRRMPPCMQQVPAALVRWFLACAHDLHRRPVHSLEDDVEADRL
jgi:hypothetical protein